MLLAGLLLAACGRAAPVDPGVLAPASALAAPTALPRLQLPADDAPHKALTEWWYYTGHLTASDGHTYGFEFVIFEANRRGGPTAYAAHFAVTDNTRGQFRFDQRSSNGSVANPAAGFDLNLDGWIMRGSAGNDRLTAAMAEYGLDLSLDSQKPAVLHDGNGLISFGPAGDSYYYSRTRLAVSGTIVDHGQPAKVSGLAWMDHQWGDFISSGGGWDWFSLQLNDRSELMLFFLRDPQGQPILPYGTLVAPDGQARILAPSDFAQSPTGSWTSPSTNITYPSGWNVTAAGLRLALTPTVKDQELNTTTTTGTVYWEGDVSISGAGANGPVQGDGYVELVGYRPNQAR
ncbi:MAG: carotenoid 1,2-hydratase [Chloroflexi bacterium]|nr:carotenoid 1,2-hydratase [Chloroflexota bacterium]